MYIDICGIRVAISFKLLSNKFMNMLIKDGLSLKVKDLHIHLYFIATKYLQNYALVEYKDN